MKRILEDVPANPMTALQQYYQAKDEKEDSFNRHKSTLGKIVDAVEGRVEQAIDKAAISCFGRGNRSLQTQRSIEVVPDAKQLEDSHPPKKRLREIEQDFLQGTGPTEFDTYRERRFDARMHQPVVNGIRFRNIA